jgi:hypothetical protein
VPPDAAARPPAPCRECGRTRSPVPVDACRYRSLASPRPVFDRSNRTRASPRPSGPARCLSGTPRTHRSRGHATPQHDQPRLALRSR